MNDWPFETLNGAHFATSGSNTVRVPAVTTTATADPCVCQPKLPPGATLIASRTTAPALAWMVVACIVPTPSGVATIGAPAPADGATATRAATSAAPSSLIF